MEKQIAKRTALRSVMTKRMNEFRKTIEEDSPISEILLCKEKLESVWKQLNEVSVIVGESLEVEDIPQDIEDRMKYEEYIVTARTQMKTLEGRGQSGEEGCIGRGYNAKLPKLKMPEFDGDVLTWLGFWEIYSENVHNNNTLTDTEKFSYLRTLIKGKATAVISGFQLSASNYKFAIELLQKRYGCRNKIIRPT